MTRAPAYGSKDRGHPARAPAGRPLAWRRYGCRVPDAVSSALRRRDHAVPSLVVPEAPRPLAGRWIPA